MFEDLKKILDEQLHLNGMEITKESRIKEDLGADSLDVLQMLMTIGHPQNGECFNNRKP